MKSLICLFLSVYVLLLAVLPCADDCLAPRPGQEPVSVAADQPTHAKDGPVDDLCSPLCICACCGTITDQPPVFCFTLSVPVPLTNYGPTVVKVSSLQVSLPTWQPPQLS